MIPAAERVRIEELYAEYCMAFDALDDDWWVSLFTADAAFHGLSERHGHDELRALIAEHRERRGDRSPMQSQHWNSGLILRPLAPNETLGYCYVTMLVALEARGTPQMVSLAWYEDRVVQQDGRWLFASRRVHFSPVGDVSRSVDERG